MADPREITHPDGPEARKPVRPELHITSEPTVHIDERDQGYPGLPPGVRPGDLPVALGKVRGARGATRPQGGAR